MGICRDILAFRVARPSRTESAQISWSETVDGTREGRGAVSMGGVEVQPLRRTL